MKFDKLATKTMVKKTVASLKKNNFEPIVVNTREEALAKIRELIPKGVSVMNGSSVTLQEIGFVEVLKTGDHNWNNLHANILAEKDPAKQAILRKQSVLSDYYVGSVHALTENGELVIASNSGSQLPHIVFTSSNLIFVVGAQKIVPKLGDAFKRIEKYVVPLEEKHMQQLYKVHTFWSKTLIFNKENAGSGRKVSVIIVNDSLGF